MITEKQKAAINFCETWAKIKFDGDIDSFEEVSSFYLNILTTLKVLQKMPHLHIIQILIINEHDFRNW